jgi:AcrR family transcriptional regulator
LKWRRGGERARRLGDIQRRFPAFSMSPLQEFGTKGFASTSTNEIAKKAGVSEQLLYHYFDGKRDLYALVLSHLAEDLYNVQLGVDYEGLLPHEAIKQSFLVLYDAFGSRELAVTITID